MSSKLANVFDTGYLGPDFDECWSSLNVEVIKSETTIEKSTVAIESHNFLR